MTPGSACVSYSYDSNGNRTNTGYSTGTNNQLSSDGTYNYTYDNEGNLTQKTAISGGAYTTYTWDFRNRLTDVKNYTSTGTLTQRVHYVYDVYDRLIGKQLDPTGGGTYTTTQRFVYDGNNIILAYDGSGTLTDRLLPLPAVGVPSSGGGGSQTLTDEKSGTVNWHFVDNEGTVRDVAQYNSGTNTTTVVDHLKFDSFGNITAQSNSANQPIFAYTGQMFDSSTGLYWYHARWYDPHTGRFISQDPSGFAPGDADLYRYVGNNVTDRVDPTGLDGMAVLPQDVGQSPAAPQNAGSPSADLDSPSGAAALAALPQNSGSILGAAGGGVGVFSQQTVNQPAEEPRLPGRGPKPVPPPSKWPKTDAPLALGYVWVFNTITGKFEAYRDDGLIPLPAHLVARPGDTPVTPPDRKMRGGPEVQERRGWEIDLKNVSDINGRPRGQEGNIYGPKWSGPGWVRGAGGWIWVEWGLPRDDWKWGHGWTWTY